MAGDAVLNSITMYPVSDLNNQERYHVSSVKAAFEILFAFLDASSDQGTLGVSELARLTNQTKNQTFRLLQTMSSMGVVTQNASDRNWALSYRLLELGSAARSRLSLVDAARESLDALHRDLGDQILLGVLTADFATIHVDIRRAPDLALLGEVGSRFALHAGGGSKLLLAFSSPEYVEEYLRIASPLKRFTTYTCIQASLVREECARIRSQGYALSFRDLSLDRCSIAVPVRDRDGEVIAGISASSPASRFREEDRQRKLELLSKASADVTNRLGGIAGRLNKSWTN